MTYGDIKMKVIKNFAGILLLLILSAGLYACLKPVPVNVKMIDNEVFFVLEDEQEISGIQVVVFNPGKGNSLGDAMWATRHDLTTEVKQRKYPKLREIKYGQTFEEFPQVAGPVPLKRNVEYLVGIDMGDKFAREVFIITDDNKVVMPRRQGKGKVPSSIPEKKTEN